MAVTIRDVAESDADWAVGLLVSWDPAIPADAYRRVLASESATLRRCRVAERSGHRLGLAAVVEFDGMPRPMVSIVVDPGHRGTGIGSLLKADTWPHVAGLELAAGMPDDDEASLAVAQHWGFELLGHGVESAVALDERPGDPELPAGVSLVAEPAAALADDRAAELDLVLARVADYPEAAIYGNTISRDVVLQLSPAAIWLMAVDEQGVLAATAVDPREGGEWYVVFTASDPRARGRGLARAVKQAAHCRAFDAGARSVRTTNEARNEPMRALNASLGYERVGGDLRLVRRVNGR